MPRRGLGLALLLAGLLLPGLATAGSDELQWNAGLGLATLIYPSWRGADDSNTLTLPAPVFSAWTEQAQLGQGGFNARFGLRERWQLRLSASGSLPVDSDDAPLREGMDDLDPTLEAGPALGWHSPERGRWHLRAETLLRGILSLSFDDPRWLGWTLQPRLALHYEGFGAQAVEGVQARLAVGPIWAQNKQHRYFYAVTADEARPDRPAYDPGGGYSGTRANLSGTWSRGRLRVSAYVGYDDLRNTAFADSPLRPREDYWLSGLFLSWRFLGPPRPLDLDD